MLDIQNKISRLRPRGGTWCSAGAAILSLSVLLFCESFFLDAAAFAGLLLSLFSLAGRFGPRLDRRLVDRWPRYRETLDQTLPYGIVTLATLAALGPITLGQMPISQDHANHYFATHVLVHDLIPSGRFFGWTDQYGTGFPFGDTYHTASYLVTGLLHWLTFGLVSLQKSYAFGIVVVWLVPALAVTAWARRMAGAAGATLAGIAFVLDMGSDREGGWVYAMFHGVWAQHFGVGVWLFALLALWRLTERPDTRRLSGAVLLGGLSLWIHPMNAIGLFVGGLFMLIVQFLAPSGSAPARERQGVLALIPGLVLSAVVGLVWVLRMMLASDVVFAWVAYWEPLAQLMEQLLRGEFFDNLLAAVSILGLLGLIQVLARGGRFRVYTAVLLAILLLLGSMTLILESDLGLAGGTLGIMQYRRFAVAAKPLFYVLAAVGASSFGAALSAAYRARIKGNLPLRLLVTVVSAPLLLAAIHALPGLLRSPVAMPLTESRAGEAANMQAIRETLKKEASRCPEGICRAVYWEKPGHGGLYPVIAMADTGYAWQPTLPLPANNFKWLNPTADIDTMASRGVSVVISKWPQSHPKLTPIGRFGHHHLYRLEGARNVRAEIKGPGSLAIEEWRPEHRVIRLNGVTGQSVLILHQPPYRKWHASQAGADLQIASMGRQGQVLSRISGLRNGDLILEYDDTAGENGVTVLGWLLILGAVAGLLLRPRDLLLPRLLTESRVHLLHRVFGYAALGLLVVLMAGMLIGGRIAARHEWLADEPVGARITEVLHQSSPDTLIFEPERHCIRPYVRNPRFGCSERDQLPRLLPAEERRGKIPSCLAVGIPPNGRTALTYRLPEGTTHIKGYLHHVDGADVKGTLLGADLGKANRRGTRFQVPVGAGVDQVTFTLSAKKAATACLEAVAVQSP